MGQYPNRVRALRKTHGWSQEELGDKIGLSQTQVGKIERGTQRIQPHVLEQLADVFQVSTWKIAEYDRDERHRTLLSLFDRMSAEQQRHYIEFGEFTLRPAESAPAPQRPTGKRRSG